MRAPTTPLQPACLVPDAEILAAFEQAKAAPAFGLMVHLASPERPYVAFWFGANKRKTFVGKRAYSNQTIQGCAVHLAEATGFASEVEAWAALPALGYDAPWMNVAHRDHLDEVVNNPASYAEAAKAYIAKLREDGEVALRLARSNISPDQLSLF